MAKVFIVLLLAYVSACYCATMTPELEKQLADMKKMVQQVCQPKFKISDARMEEAMHSKIVPADKDFKCFLQCTLEMAGIMTKNKLNFDNARKQIETLLPDEMKGPLLKAMDICQKKIEIAKDKCETAYNIGVCFQTESPDISF